MSHRTDDLHHIREARRPAHHTDSTSDKTQSAYEAIVRGDYKGARSRESGDQANRPRAEAERTGGAFGHEPQAEPVAAVHARLRRTALVPRIETVPCPEHNAAVGQPCFKLGDAGAGVCGSRIENCAARVIARAGMR